MEQLRGVANHYKDLLGVENHCKGLPVLLGDI
jgi:hypothetical protein